MDSKNTLQEWLGSANPSVTLTNLQIAVNKVAADVSSAYFILNSADSESELSDLIKRIYVKMNNLAIDAEQGIVDLEGIKDIEKSINSFSILLKKKKTLNPLISDELISVMATSVIDCSKLVNLAEVASKNPS